MMIHPQIPFSFLHMLVASIAAFFFGFLWYGPLFGKKWAQLMGFDMSKPPDKKMMQRSLMIQFVGLLLMSYVLTFSNSIWRPSVWGLSGGDGPDYLYGFFGAFFTWLGFYVPMQLGKVAWEFKPWSLFFLNTAHDFINLLIISSILAYWH